MIRELVRVERIVRVVKKNTSTPNSYIDDGNLD